MSKDKKNTLNILKDGKKIIPISLVTRALEELTNRAGVSGQKQCKKNLDRLCNSLLKINIKSSSVIKPMLEAGISVKEIFEVYLPGAARQLGDHWVQNHLTFAEVTLATSRLQTVAKEFENLYIGAMNSGVYGPEIMIINPKGEQHTFGAQMICRQFQRLGAHPYLSINNNLTDINAIIAQHKFKLIGISLSNYKLCDSKSQLRSLIDTIKKLKIPIVVGGSLVNTHKNAVKSLNVDLITDDALHALRYLNINFSRVEYKGTLVTT